MSDKEQIVKLYHDMYAAMVEKDKTELERVHGDSFVLIHMTGMHQSKRENIQAIMDGTLNYYSEKTESLDIKINENNTAMLIGQSLVSAAVFGGGKHTWRLQLRFELKKIGDAWKLTKAQASTW